MKSFHLIFSGRVQGVFFRQNTKNKAIELGLTGFAKNLGDGTVEVVAQGEKKVVMELIEFLKKNPGAIRVEDVRMKEKEGERFKEFSVIG